MAAATHSDAAAEPAVLPVEADTSTAEVLRRSFAYCRRVARREARNFYYGLKLTPEPRRSAVYSVYAFMRACDDLADEPGTLWAEPGAAAALSRLEAFRGQMEAVLDAAPDSGAAAALGADAPFWPAFRHVVHTYGIERAHLHAMLDGQRADLAGTRYRTFDDLHGYCYKVAGVVGLVCIRIWGAGGDPVARQLAEHRGIALQLTNILRDLAEDAGRGRVYLPEEELERFGYPREALLAPRGDANFDELMRFQIERARRYYDMSSGLESRLDAPCRATCWALGRIYRDLLEKIAADPRRVLRGRVRLGRLHKLGIALRAAWGGQTDAERSEQRRK